MNYSKKTGLFKEQNVGFSAQTHSVTLREAAKKKKIPPIMARPLRGGGENNFFWNLFFILFPFKNKNYFTLDNLSKYEKSR